MSKTVVYVSNAESGDLSVFALDESSGELASLQTVEIGGMVMPMAVGPGQRTMYVARRSEPLAAVALAIDPADGRLTRIGEGPLPHSMAFVATDASGRFLLSASYGGHLAAVSPIGADCVPRAAQQLIETGPNAHCIRPGPDDRHVYVSSLGSDQLTQWRFEPQTGRLDAAQPPFIRMHAGSGPRHFVFHPHRPIAYLLGELDGSITPLDIDSESGSLSPRDTVSALPPDFDGKAWAADIHLTPDGRFLYASERNASTLSIFRVAADGTPTLLGHQLTETQPRGFAIDPRGRFLVAAGQLSHHLAVYAIDPDTGALTLRSRAPAGRDPNWVEIITLAT